MSADGKSIVVEIPIPSVSWNTWTKSEQVGVITGATALGIFVAWAALWLWLESRRRARRGSRDSEDSEESTVENNDFWRKTLLIGVGALSGLLISRWAQKSIEKRKREERSDRRRNGRDESAWEMDQRREEDRRSKSEQRSSKRVDSERKQQVHTEAPNGRSRSGRHRRGQRSDDNPLMPVPSKGLAVPETLGKDEISDASLRSQLSRTMSSVSSDSPEGSESSSSSEESMIYSTRAGPSSLWNNLGGRRPVDLESDSFEQSVRALSHDPSMESLSHHHTDENV